jgi:manganese efflux pump family protein
MTFTAILLIALALAVDAFAVALAVGISLPQVGRRRTLRLSWHFGFFQAAMYIIGWSAGLAIRPLMAAVSHWLAFGLLCFAGGRMIWEAVHEDKEERRVADPTRGRTMVFLALATSIDSLAVGVSFSILHATLWLPALMIGTVAFLLTAIGLHLGRAAGKAAHLGAKAEVLGGLVLVAIGLKILHDHGVF